MKYIILLIFCLLTVSVSAQIVDSNIDAAAANNINLYKLDDAQATSYKEMLKAKQKAYNAATNKDKIMDAEAIAEADKAYYTSFSAILNDDQKEILKVQTKLADNIKSRMIMNNRTQQSQQTQPQTVIRQDK